MNKIFISTGELSGDRIGAWYITKNNLECTAIGGQYLKNAGAEIYETIDQLSIVGIYEIIRHIPFILKFLKRVSRYIIDNDFTEVVLIDFPGFNLMLAKRLKKLKPSIKITYVSPPQLWVWGSWRVKKIRKYCDDVVVIYPFEVEWYKKHGVHARWLGYPFLTDFNDVKKPAIAILPGSRKSETKSLMPFFINSIKLIQKKHPEIKFILPLSLTFKREFIEEMLDGLNVEIVSDLNQISSCFLAISKPGTASLQASLMGVPTIVIYKTSYFTYSIAKWLINVKYMGLSNLILNKALLPELIQDKCTPEEITKETFSVYEHYLKQDAGYLGYINDLKSLHAKLSSK